MPLLVAAIIRAPANYRVVHLVILIMVVMKIMIVMMVILMILMTKKHTNIISFE